MAAGEDTPFFIVGPGRSGTTLVRSLLAAHPRIAVTPETHFLKFAALAAAREGRPGAEAPADPEAFWQALVESPRFLDLDVEPEAVRRRLNASGEATYRGVFAAMLAAYGARWGKPRVGEKTPGHVRMLDRLLAWFPEARVLLLRRDPRAVVASQLKTPWVRPLIAPPGLSGGYLVRSRLAQVARYAEDWRQVHQAIQPQLARDPRVSVVTYEALVRDPEGELRRVCAHLGEPYDPAMLSERSDETVPAWRAGRSDAWRQAHHARTLKPVSTDALETWRGELSAVEAALIEGRCAAGMAAAGYRPATGAAGRIGGRAVYRAAVAGARGEAALRGTARRTLGIALARRAPGYAVGSAEQAAEHARSPGREGSDERRLRREVS